MESKLTLHEAIKIVLEEAKLPLTAREIADIINNRELYSRNDGLAVPTSQIHARVKNYYNIFEKINGRIALLESKQRGIAKSSIDIVINKILNCVNNLNGIIPNEELYPSILFILSLKKEGLINTKSSAKKILHNLKNIEFFNKISHCFSAIIQQFSDSDFISISKQMDEIVEMILRLLSAITLRVVLKTKTYRTVVALVPNNECDVGCGRGAVHVK